MLYTYSQTKNANTYVSMFLKQDPELRRSATSADSAETDLRRSHRALERGIFVCLCVSLCVVVCLCVSLRVCVCPIMSPGRSREVSPGQTTYMLPAALMSRADLHRQNRYLAQRVPSLFLAISFRMCLNCEALKGMFPWRTRYPLS